MATAASRLVVTAGATVGGMAAMAMAEAAVVAGAGAKVVVARAAVVACMPRIRRTRGSRCI